MGALPDLGPNGLDDYPSLFPHTNFHPCPRIASGRTVAWVSDSANQRFARFFAESRDGLRRYIRRFVRSSETAEEIVQEAFLRTYEQGGEAHTPRAFLFSTARNLATDRRRHERAASTDSVPDFDDPRVLGSGGPLEDALIADEASRHLKHAIDRLPPQSQAALTLKVFHGYSYKEIAATLGLSERTVEKHIGRGLDRVHTYLVAKYSQHGLDDSQPGGRDGCRSRE